MTDPTLNPQNTEQNSKKAKFPQIKGWRIHLQGQVQGVGFRPFVYHLARKLGLKGWVNNTVEGVKIHINASAELASTFYAQVRSLAPRLAHITAHTCQEVLFEYFEDFSIIESTQEGNPNLLISPDFALCQACQEELNDPKDRRYAYAFITCTNCGPRYSIVNALPYDRIHTAMQPFEMCQTCSQEYYDIQDRRYFSQTNSCLTCGVKMQLFDSQSIKINFESQAHTLEFTAKALQEGKILALKGIGGYLLLADATSSEAILALRKRKNRPSKPFAVMYPDLKSLEKDAYLTPQAQTTLKSAAAPIVLLSFKSNNSLASQAIASGLDKIGVMLPYAPLLAILATLFGKPLVATSANISNAPLVFKEEDALENLVLLADYILTHNREIYFPQDDSVMQWTDFEQVPILLRRARGYAPTYLSTQILAPQASILAVGAMLKSTFTLQHAGNLYVSQYLGDLTNFDTQLRFELLLERFCKLLKVQPKVILKDLHPQYPSTHWAEEYAAKNQILLHSIQHHEAHFGAVLAENNLLSTKEKILGVIWDGTGYGTDGQVWGGEFFVYQQGMIERVGHIGEFPQLLGDKMSLEPRIAALALSRGDVSVINILQPKFSAIEWQNYLVILQNSSLKSTSMGRLFDAVASLLGLADKQSYEGEAALYLEVLARKYFKQKGLLRLESCITFSENAPKEATAQHIFQALAEAYQAGKDKSYLAAQFHCTLLDWIEMQAKRFQTKHLAFSGGVFQNSLLIDLVKRYLSTNLHLYFHHQTAPNDECISLGQWARFQMEKYRSS